jgi:hypothetical protein
MLNTAANLFSTTMAAQPDPTGMQPPSNIIAAIRIHKRQSDQSIPFDPTPVCAAVERALVYSASVVLAVSTTVILERQRK